MDVKWKCKIQTYPFFALDRPVTDFGMFKSKSRKDEGLLISCVNDEKKKSTFIYLSMKHLSQRTQFNVFYQNDIKLVLPQFLHFWSD